MLKDNKLPNGHPYCINDGILVLLGLTKQILKQAHDNLGHNGSLHVPQKAISLEGIKTCWVKIFATVEYGNNKISKQPNMLAYTLMFLKSLLYLFQWT